MNKEKLIEKMREVSDAYVRDLIDEVPEAAHYLLMNDIAENMSISCAEAALKELDNEWVRVSDYYPDVTGEYIVMINGFIGVAYYEECGLIYRFHREDYDDFKHEDVTHWMSLGSIPSPPKDNQHG